MSTEEISKDKIEMCQTELNSKFGSGFTNILNELRKKYIIDNTEFFNKTNDECTDISEFYNEAIDKPFRELDEIGYLLNDPKKIEEIKGITTKEGLKYLNDLRDKIIKFNEKMAESDIDPKDHVNNISELLELINSKLGIDDENESSVSALTSMDKSLTDSPNDSENNASLTDSPNSNETYASSFDSLNRSINQTNFNLDPKAYYKHKLIGILDPLKRSNKIKNGKGKGKGKSKGKSKKGGNKSKKNQTKSKRRQRKSKKRR